MYCRVNLERNLLIYLKRNSRKKRGDKSRVEAVEAVEAGRHHVVYDLRETMRPLKVASVPKLLSST